MSGDRFVKNVSAFLILLAKTIREVSPCGDAEPAQGLFDLLFLQGGGIEMFTQWFGTRPSRSPQRDRFFRPSLEYLEGRLAPSSMVPMDPGHGHGNGNGPPGHSNGNGGNVIGPVNAPSINQAGNVHNNIHINAVNSFNNTITNSFILMPAQQASVAGLFSISFGLAGALSSPQLGSLLSEEVALGVDTYLNGLGLSKLIPSLPGDIAALKADIAANALGSTAIGSAIGSLVYNATLDALTTAQPTI
jgi:hypothetical protein